MPEGYNILKRLLLVYWAVHRKYVVFHFMMVDKWDETPGTLAQTQHFDGESSLSLVLGPGVFSLTR